MDRMVVDADAKKTGYRYFAFISYSSKDAKWAKWLQRKLEGYRFPAKLKKEHTELPKRIFPVFRDATDLSGVVLEESLQKELGESEFLIVLCSPNSAKSEWVGKEIEYFRMIGGEKRIIPFIIGGDTAEGCMHEKIKEIKPTLLGVDAVALGKNKAFLRLVATMLNLRYDELVMRDNTRKRQKYIVATIAGAVLFSGIFGLWYNNAEHSAYYSDCIFRYEIPEGLGRLSKSEQKNRIESYRIVKKGGKVNRVEIVNSKGTITATNKYTDMTEFPLQEYNYDTNEGILKEISVKDEYGNEKMVKALSYGGNRIAIDFHRAEDEIAVSTKITALGQYYTEDEEESAIIRQINTYDENGFKIKERYYRDTLENSGMDNLGIYGKIFTYNENGQIESTTFIDENEKVLNCKNGYAQIKYGYEGLNLNRIEYFDADGNPCRDTKGVSSYLTEYDEYGNCIKIKYLSEEGLLYTSKENVAIKMQEIKNGEVISVKHYDENENPTIDITGVHEVKAEYDKKGRTIKKSGYDKEGNPAKVIYDNYCSVYTEYDKNGRLTLEKYYDVNGDPCCDRESGTYILRCEYDENGHIIKSENLGKDGELIRSIDGYARCIYIYNDKGELEEARYYNENEELCRNSSNFAVAKLGYDVYGKSSEIRYYDENEEPCYSYQGVATIKKEYENGKLVSEKYFDINDEAMLVGGNYHEIRYKYNDIGRKMRVSYHNIDGSLTFESVENNYAAVEYEYDRYGNVAECRYYDVQSAPSKDYIYSVVKTKYNSRGMITEEEYETEGYKELDYYYYLAEYDEKDNILKEYYLGKNNSEAKGIQAKLYEYDSRNRIVSRESLYAGKVLELDSYEYDALDNIVKWENLEYNGVSKEIKERFVLFEYDQLGNNTLCAFTDKDGNLVMGDEGSSVIKREYTPEGYLLSEENYGPEGTPVVANSGYFRCECKYDYAGNLTEVRFYEKDGTPVKAESGMAHCELTEYDATGKILYKKWLDENNEPFLSPEGTYAVKYEYSPLGERKKSIFYEANDNVCAEVIHCAIIGTMNENIDFADIKRGDIVLKFGDWEFDENEDLALSYAALWNEIIEKRETEKEITVYSIEQNRIINRIYSEHTGFNVSAGSADAEHLSAALELFSKY